VYYVAFTLVIAVPIILLRQVRRPNVSELVRLAVPLLVMVTPTLVSILLARFRAGRDVVTGGLPWGRTFLDSDWWAGQIIDLVLPWQGHRMTNVATRTQAYDALTGRSGEASSLGVVALTGVVIVLVAAGAALLRGRRAGLDPMFASLAVAATLATLFLTRGGFGALTAFFVTPQIRTWSRLFLFIALFGLLGMAIVLTKLGKRTNSRIVLVGGSALLLILGVLDQTNPARAPQHAANRATLNDLATFDDTVQSALGPGCSVFVLPVVGFPEVNDPLVPDP
jgi:hypothetical protein